MVRRSLLTIVLLVLLSLLISASAQAAVAGRFTMVEGHVDVLKHGQVPAVAAKTGDGVEPGDVIRTKSKAKAQVKFVDDSVVTMAPDSRISVADFSYDAASGERQAVLRFFKGVRHTVITRIMKTQQPEFLMETHTAVLGVRGSEAYVVLLPNTTGAYSVSGLWEVGSSNPNLPDKVRLRAWQFNMTSLGQPPQLPRMLTPAMVGALQGLMNTGLTDGALWGAGGAGVTGGSSVFDILGFPGSAEDYRLPTITPKILPPAPPPPPVQQTPR